MCHNVIKPTNMSLMPPVRLLYSRPDPVLVPNSCGPLYWRLPWAAHMWPSKPTLLENHEADKTGWSTNEPKCCDSLLNVPIDIMLKIQVVINKLIGCAALPGSTSGCQPLPSWPHKCPPPSVDHHCVLVLGLFGGILRILILCLCLGPDNLSYNLHSWRCCN